MRRSRFCVIVALVLASVFSGAQQTGSGGTSPTASAPKSDAGPTQPVHISEKVAQSLRIKSVPPEYPPPARLGRIQGQVVLKALIDKNGNVEDMTLVSGHPLLAAAAVNAVKQWKYKPYVLNGEPVNVETQVIVNFTLH